MSHGDFSRLWGAEAGVHACGVQEMDLAVHYSRALEHRHVGTRDSLTIIDPQEIVLQRIIGTLRHTGEPRWAPRSPIETHV